MRIVFLLQSIGRTVLSYIGSLFEGFDFTGFKCIFRVATFHISPRDSVWFYRSFPSSRVPKTDTFCLLVDIRNCFQKNNSVYSWYLSFVRWKIEICKNYFYLNLLQENDITVCTNIRFWKVLSKPQILFR